VVDVFVLEDVVLLILDVEVDKLDVEFALELEDLVEVVVVEVVVKVILVDDKLVDVVLVEGGGGITVPVPLMEPT
jgi:hypothetical protein